ncbi:MAG: hypothetical protein JO199_02035 [Candidatus Eremiobacteraeota bacterium]|nr:hypothetical protein [Candidatus Eremiobacteraeota bacterium]
MFSLAALALSIAVTQPSTHLTLQTWKGKDLSTASSEAVKYRLDVRGTPNATLHLDASHVAQGWIAAFCTPKVCSPNSVDVTLPASGRAEYQFELIREDDTAAHRSGAVITSADGATVTAPEASI